LSEGCSLCPREKLLDDLQEQVLQWCSEGDSVVIMADMNKDVQADPVLTTATNIGFQDAVTTQHGQDAPNTHNRGSAPIDGIFMPAQLIPNIWSGYLAFSEGIPCNH